jgi:hypothetical protein
VYELAFGFVLLFMFLSPLWEACVELSQEEEEQPALEERPREPEPRRPDTRQRYTIQEPDLHPSEIYTLDGGDLDDDDELVYPE